MTDKTTLLRKIPSVDEVLRRPEVKALIAEVAPALLTSWTREALESARRNVLEGGSSASGLEAEIEALPARLKELSASLRRPPLRRVLNATGVLVHTNLGRAPIAPGALEAMRAAGASYTNLEYDLEAGERGSRGAHLQAVASSLFPGCSLLAVNNNAAAVLLVLNTLAEGKEVIISRGELVEIGGSFRIPEVMVKAGAALREIGTTNRTRLSDYRAAISDRTGLLAKVHASNYKIVGFVEEAKLEDLAGLSRERGIPLMVDQGSGSLLARGETPLADEPDVRSLLDGGAQIVTCSGDKMLGGPQAGLIVGEPALVARCAKNPLARALRIDKNRIAALAWTLAEYASGRAQKTLPVLEMLGRTPEEIGARADALAAALARAGAPVAASVEDGTSRVGGGAAPLEELPTRLLMLRPGSKSVSEYEAALRKQDLPVIARIAEGRLLVDLRTVDPAEDDLLAAALAAAAR